MMEDTYREAQDTKALIQQQVHPQRHIQKGKSLDSLIMQTDFQPWYDRKKIREAVSRESISNFGQTRERFETGYFPTERRDRPPSTNASRFDSIQPPSLPPKSEEVQIRQNALRNEHQNQSIDSCTSFSSGGTFHHRMNGLRNNNQQEYSQRYQYTYEEQLLMIYIKQNPEVVSSLGISFPDSTRYAIQDVPWRKVELRAIDDEAPSYQPQTCFPNHKQGRYVKKSQVAPVILPPSIRFRKTAENVSREMYDKRQNNEEMCGKGGSSLIAAEIRSLKEREEELRRSRSELGLPTLEDTIDMWRSGQRNFSINPLRSTLSYDYLNEDSMEPLQKTCSISELALYNDYERFDRSNENTLGFF